MSSRHTVKQKAEKLHEKIVRSHTNKNGKVKFQKFNKPKKKGKSDEKQQKTKRSTCPYNGRIFDQGNHPFDTCELEQTDKEKDEVL